MTERLYYRDARLRSFRARLVEIEDGGRKVYLDRTAFYPTSGGQPHDVGTLGGVNVVDVIDEGARVAHLLAVPWSAATGSEVNAEIERSEEHTSELHSRLH